MAEGSFIIDGTSLPRTARLEDEEDCRYVVP